jgi:hypothetical protein
MQVLIKGGGCRHKKCDNEKEATKERKGGKISVRESKKSIGKRKRRRS